MDFQKIQCFLAVAKDLNFSKAARHLYMSQSSVSYQIQALERELGVPLFSRSTTSTALTEAGKQFLPDAKKLNQVYQHIEENMKRIREEQPVIIAVPPTMLLFDLDIFTSLFEKLDRSVNRRIQKSLIQEPDESVQDLLNGKIDLLIIRDTNCEPWHKQVKITPMFYCTQFLILPSAHPLAAKEEITLEDLEGETVYISKEDPCFLPSVEKALSHNHVRVNLQYLPSYKLLLSFIEMNQGISFTALKFPVPEAVCFRPIDLRDDIQIALCSLKIHPAPEIPILSKIILQHFHDYPTQSVAEPKH